MQGARANEAPGARAPDLQKLLLELTTAIARHQERGRLFEAIAAAVRGALDFDSLRIVIPHPSGEPDSVVLYAVEGAGTLAQHAGQDFRREGTLADWVISHRRSTIVGDTAEFPVSDEIMRAEGMQSAMGHPLLVADRAAGAIVLFSGRRAAYEPRHLEALAHAATAVAVALACSTAFEQLAELKDRLADENRYLRAEIRTHHDFRELVGESAPMRQLHAAIEAVAGTDSTVLITGETGTGKELVARAVHDASPRAERALVKVNCAAISAGLVESELFGHEHGAFTGATKRRIGRFELADRGTIFLDEVGELSMETQAKLLRVLQDGEFERVGSSTTITTDARVIAATNRSLADAVESGTFRKDLFYRLNTFPLPVPPLRDRPGDIPLLASFFLSRLRTRLGKPLERLDDHSLTLLADYDWPGNVRELQNVLERAAILADGPQVVVHEPPGTGAAGGTTGTSLEQVERAHIERVLERCAWVIEGKKGAAVQLDLHPNTLRSRMARLGLRRPGS